MLSGARGGAPQWALGFGVKSDLENIFVINFWNCISTIFPETTLHTVITSAPFTKYLELYL